MANITESGTELSDLLNPENLTEQALISILRQRRIVVDDVNNFSKEALVDLFHRTVTPQPQRVMRNNRVGKVLKSKQEKIASLKPKYFEAPNLLTAAKQPSSHPQSVSQKGGLVMSTNISSSSRLRLKPPPIVVNLTKKTIIKLNKTDINPNGIIIPSSSTSQSSRCMKSPTATSPNKMIAVKRVSNDTGQNPIDGSSPKKKLKKITWP